MPVSQDTHCLIHRKNCPAIFTTPERADYPEYDAFTIPTVSALPDFVRPLNLQLSVSLQSRLTLAIVLSPGNYPQDNFLPPEGASTLNLVANVARC